MDRPSSAAIEARDRLFAGLHDGVLVIDAENRVVDLNSAAERATGHPQAEIIGQPASEVLPEWPRWVEETVRTGEAQFEISLNGWGGDRRLELRLSSLAGRQAQPGGWLVVMHDVTAQREVIDLLRDSERSLTAELNAARRLQELSTQWIQDGATEPLYDTILEALRSYLNADFASIQILHPERGTAGELELVGARGFSPSAARFWEWVRPDSQSACGLALRTRQRIAVPDVQTCEFMAGSQDQETYLSTGIHAVQTTPLISRSGTLLGAFSTHWREPHEMTETETRTVDILARQIADLIERKQIVEARIQSEKQYREMIRHAPAGIYEIDFRRKRFVSVNDAMCQILGYSREELLTMDPFDILDERSRDLFRTRIAEWLGGKKPDNDVEFRAKTRDGRFIDAILNVTFTTDETGQPLGATVVAHDITERKQAEDALRASEERFRSSVENLMDAFAIYSSIRDTDGKIVDFRVDYANEAACQLTHRKRENYIGRTVLDLYPDLRRTPIFDWYVEAVETGKHILKEDFAFDTAPHGRPGVRYFDYRIARLGDGFTASWRNVTGRKLAHDELEERVQERTEELLKSNEQLRQEIEEKIRTEHLLRLEGARLDALVRLNEMDGASLPEIAEFVLEQGIALTQSKIGFVGLLSEDESIYSLNAVSRDVVKECEVAAVPLQWHIADAGIWADAIRQRRTLFIDEYSQPDPRKKGTPPGHPPVEKLMVVPILEAAKVVAVAGVGNKATEYDRSDERQIALLLHRMWNHVQRNRAREALRDAYDELQASEERFRQLADNVREVFWMLEPGSRRVLYVSPAYEAIWGRSREELYERPKSFLDSVHPDDRSGLQRGFTTEWQTYNGEFRILRPDGTIRWIHVRSFPVYDETGAAYRLAGLATDCTERKAAEAALFQAERLTIAGKLAATLAHEINNPLQSVVGCLGLARGALESGQDPAAYLEVAHREVRRTARFVSQLRSLGRPVQEGGQEATDLNQLIDDVLTLNKKQFQARNVEVSWEPAAGLPLLTVVPDAMRQLFLNLVLNAVDAMPEGGQLRLSTARTESPPGVRVVVVDTGTGIEPGALSHLFEAFYSTKPEGLGVGLYVSQRIVEQHGGRIDVESTVGEGTTFTVWVPA